MLQGTPGRTRSALRRQLGGRRVRLTDDDRRRLAARAYQVGRAAGALSPSSLRTIIANGIIRDSTIG
jgi:hypothetical protein